MDPTEILLEQLGQILRQYQETEDGEETENGVRYRTLLAPEDQMTSDNRYIEAGALSWRDGPIHVMWSDSEQAHGDAVLVGTFVNLHKETIDGVVWVVADDIDWDLHEDNEAAARAKRLVDEGRLTGVSIHMADMDADIDCEEDGDDIECQLTVHAGTIAAATIVAIPAFEDAVIEPVAAAAAVVDLYSPPREWFADPELEGPTALTVTDDGRLFGHLALWESCHIGFEGVCITPPRDATDYEEFHSHSRVTTEDGALIPAGVITVDGTHAPLNFGPEATVRHYDATATVAAYARAGEDEHGVWVAGAVAPDLPSVTVEKLKRLSLSGDWRTRAGRHFLAAVLSVPVPGYSVRAHVAAGAQVSLLSLGPANEAREPMTLVASAMNAIADRLQSIEDYLTREAREAELEAALAVFTPEEPAD